MYINFLMKRIFLFLNLFLLFISASVFATGVTTPTNTQQPTTNSPTVASQVDEYGNILWLDNEDLRKGNVSLDTIPRVIVYVIEFLIGIAGTVAIIGLIYNAVQMQLHSGIMGDTSGVDKAKKWMIGSLIGFVVAVLAWFIVTRFVEILSTIS
jgi:Type IV secretion system pilin